MIFSKHSSFPELETQRLLLRQLKASDANEIFELRSSESINEFVDRPRATSVADATAFINKINGLIQSNETFYWAITQKPDTSLIGTVTLWNIDAENRSAEVGYELRTAFHGKGIMQEALSAVFQFGFTTMNLNSIEAWTHSKNERSIHAVKKFGFKRDQELEKRKAYPGMIEHIYVLKSEKHGASLL